MLAFHDECIFRIHNQCFLVLLIKIIVIVNLAILTGLRILSWILFTVNARNSLDHVGDICPW